MNKNRIIERLARLSGRLMEALDGESEKEWVVDCYYFCTVIQCSREQNRIVIGFCPGNESEDGHSDIGGRL